jgi:60 kDa SS-A/Ro ribonucleoprotein
MSNLKQTTVVSGKTQTDQISPEQVQNNAGGFVFVVDEWKRLDRFLILGSDAPTYYQTAQKLTDENAQVVRECLATDPFRTLDVIYAISASGRAPKNDPAIFALAMATTHPDVKVRSGAYTILPYVCRTATHLFMFVTMARNLGHGWGRGMKRAVANWYDDKPLEKVAYQAIKYRSREGYDHKRMLRLARPAKHIGDPQWDALNRWILGRYGNEGDPELPQLIYAHEQAMKAKTVQELLPLVMEHNLPWEALPTWANAEPTVWEVMIPHLGLTAMIRNLGNMTRLGTLKSEVARDLIVSRLTNPEELKRARVHPFSILLALSTYQSGHGAKGKGEWTPDPIIAIALDKAFYTAFSTVEPTGKRYMIGLDISGSMVFPMMGSSLTCREAGAALTLILMATEPECSVFGFTAATILPDSITQSGWMQTAQKAKGQLLGGITPLEISPEKGLAHAVQYTERLPYGRTDCSLPMRYALASDQRVDVFIVVTDNETWAGPVHPHVALQEYRQKTGIPAKLAVIAMTATKFSIADPNDAGMMDFCGFSSDGPAVLADFAKQ